MTLDESHFKVTFISHTVHVIKDASFQKSYYYKIDCYSPNYCNLILSLKCNGCFSELRQPQWHMWPINVSFTAQPLKRDIFFLRTFLADIKGFVHFQIKMSL